MSHSSYSFSHEAMTTSFEVIVTGQEQEYARQAAAAAFREIDRLERLLNRYEPGSDIGQVNLLGPQESVLVSVDTMECMQAAQWVHAASGGLFDPTIGPLIQLWRPGNGGGRQTGAQDVAAALKRVGMHRLEMDTAGFSLGWKETVGELDLGGIGKGFAIDRAAEVLGDWEIDNAVISGGGSTALAIGTGLNGADGWRLGIGGAWGEKANCDSVVLKNRALSGSGKEVKGEHIIDPRTGRPVATHVAAWAVAPTAAMSDGLATAFMMMSRGDVETLCKTRPDLGAFVVQPSDRIVRMGCLKRSLT